MTLKNSFICLKNVRLYAYHGVLEQERVVGNNYIINLSLEYNVEKAALSDDVCHTISYSEVFDIVKQTMQQPRNLLETVAYNIAQNLFNKFEKIESINIELTKENPPMGMVGEGASVILNLIK